MKVKEFVEQFIERNTLVRLWYNTKGGHEEVIEGDKPMMEWELEKCEYQDNNVVGVTDIQYLNSRYNEAVNLVIER